ncbi:MAG: hypothetical protein HQ582_28945 [Planctomycetes bacterium]|nr:hypothetical protein [Planctomycetota bacterium]
MAWSFWLSSTELDFCRQNPRAKTMHNQSQKLSWLFFQRFNAQTVWLTGLMNASEKRPITRKEM